MQESVAIDYTYFFILANCDTLWLNFFSCISPVNGTRKARLEVCGMLPHLVFKFESIFFGFGAFVNKNLLTWVGANGQMNKGRYIVGKYRHTLLENNFCISVIQGR